MRCRLQSFIFKNAFCLKRGYKPMSNIVLAIHCYFCLSTHTRFVLLRIKISFKNSLGRI